MDCGEDRSDHRTGDVDIGQMEDDGTGVTYDVAPILLSLGCGLVGDQSTLASGRSMQRKKVAKLQAIACICSRTLLSRNGLHKSPVQLTAYLPTFVCCSAVPRWQRTAPPSPASWAGY